LAALLCVRRTSTEFFSEKLGIDWLSNVVINARVDAPVKDSIDVHGCAGDNRHMLLRAELAFSDLEGGIEAVHFGHHAIHQD